jgi:hypothetical protein
MCIHVDWHRSNKANKIKLGTIYQNSLLSDKNKGLG